MMREELLSPATKPGFDAAVRRLPVPCLVLFAVITLLIAPGCATPGGETLKIDARDVVGMHYMPGELSLMLNGLGYEWIPIVDSEFRTEVKMLERDGYYHMRFEYAETRQVRVDARIRVRDGVTRLRFYETDGGALSPSSRALLQKLQERAELEFGSTNVAF